MKKNLLLLLCFFATVADVQAQYFFNGKILNAQQEPLPGVNIILNKNVPVAVSDTAGNFNFQFSSLQFELLLSHVGYFKKTIKVDSSLPAAIIMLRDETLEEQVVVHAFERSGSNQAVAAAVTVISKNNLERLGTPSLVAAVNAVPGVKMDERSPGSYRLSIRGNLLRSTFGVRNVKVYWNGIPFTDASGNTYLNQVAPGNLGQMEIIKGPSGSMYGSGTGGVVLLTTGNSNEEKSKAIELQSTAGSYGLFSANAAYQQNGVNSTNISISHLQADGYRQHARMRRDVAHYTGNYQLSKRHSLVTHIFYSDLFYQTPGGLTAAELAANPRQSRPAAGVFKSAITQQAAIYLKTIYTGLSSTVLLNERWKLSNAVYASYTDFKNPTIRNYEKKYEKGLGARSVLQYKQSIFTGTMGAELQQGFFNTAVYGNVEGRRDTLQFNATIHSRQANVFAQAGIELPKGFLLEAGLSYNNFFYDYSRQSRTGNINEESSFTPQFVPRITLLKKLPWGNLYAAVSKGYSVPSIDEVFAGNDEFNKSLKAETAMNYEVGAKAMFIQNKLWMDAAFYIFGLQNTIVSRRDAAGGDFYTNAGTTKQQGAELALHYLPVNNTSYFIRRLKFSGSFTGIRARFKNYQQGTSVFDGNELTGTPPNVLVVNADILFANRFYANTTFSYTDHIPLNDANSFYAPAYSLYHVKLGYKTTLGAAIEAHFFIASERSGRNPYSLGNDLNAAGNRFFNPAAPQTLSVGIQCRFSLR